MTHDEKKILMLLKAVIFYYHGLDEEEERILNDSATELDAFDELRWAIKFVEEDEITAFRRAREYFSNTISGYDKDKKMEYLDIVWEANNRKGYITEMEATGMLKLAKDWNVQSELLNKAREKVINENQ